MFVANLYNSIPLALWLLAHKTYCTGILSPDQTCIPDDVKSAKLQPGETIARYAEGVGGNTDREECRLVPFHRSWQRRCGVQREKPLPIVQYNLNTKGVDRIDQMTSYYPSENKTLRWYLKIFVHFLQIIMMNAHKLRNCYNSRNTKSLYDFRLEVIGAMLPAKQQSPLRPPRNSLHVLSKTSVRDTKGCL